MNKSSIFVINKNQNIIFPPNAFVDTNVFLDIYLNRQHKSDWLQFMGQATSHGTEFVYTLHTLREIRNILNFQIHDKKAKELNIKKFRDTPAWKVLENDPNYNFGKDVTEETKKVHEYLENAGFKFETITNDAEMFELENLYSNDYDLGPGDTAIAATMDRLKINSICTNDAGFFKTDNLNIYSPTEKASKVAKNRNNSFIPYKTIK